MKNHQLRNQKGVAILMALSIITLIQFLVMALSRETYTEYISNAIAIKKVKSYYAAKAGVKIALLRINAFRKIKASLGDKTESFDQYLEMIWKFPFDWPPVSPVELTKGDKEAFKKTKDEALMTSTIHSVIEDEGSKIDVNDLGSPSKALREKTKAQLQNLFKTRLEQEDDWARTHRDMKYDEVINNIIDWVDQDTESLNGGEESALYSSVKELDKDAEMKLPPNRWFRTLEEVRMVAGVTDEIWGILAPNITIWGQKGINPNLAPKEVLKSIDISITDIVADAIIKRRNDKAEGGPFKTEDDFMGFIQQKGAKLKQGDNNFVPLVFTPPTNFRVISNGIAAGHTATEITAVVYDPQATQTALSESIKNDANNQNGGNGGNKQNPNGGSGGNSGNAGNKAKTNKDTQKGPPRIVNWTER